MGGVGIWHWLVVSVFFVNVVAFWRLLPTVGLPRILAILAFFPPIAFVLLWVVAFRTPPQMSQG